MEHVLHPSLTAIRVLVADSNQMQCQLLVSALRRRPEFKVTSCILDPDVILRVIGSAPVGVLCDDLQKACLEALHIPREICIEFAAGHTWQASARVFVDTPSAVSLPSLTRFMPALIGAM